jgi:dynein heavy chain
LRKCFENIVKLQFDQTENVTGMISGEGEIVPLRGYQARGSEVEEWLKALEEQMKYSLKVVMR